MTQKTVKINHQVLNIQDFVKFKKQVLTLGLGKSKHLLGPEILINFRSYIKNGGSQVDVSFECSEIIGDLFNEIAGNKPVTCVYNYRGFNITRIFNYSTGKSDWTIFQEDGDSGARMPGKTLYEILEDIKLETEDAPKRRKS